MRQVLVDAGPLVALVNRHDRWHIWVRDQFAQITPPLLTCEAAISEACFLLRGSHDGMSALLALLERGVVDVSFGMHEHVGAVATLMRRYANIPMSLADACLVRMSEMAADRTVFTLDSDFRIYRRHHRQHIPVLMPPAGNP